MARNEQHATVPNPKTKRRPQSDNGPDLSDELKSLRLNDRDRSGKPRRLLFGVFLLLLLCSVGVVALFGDRLRIGELLVQLADGSEIGIVDRFGDRIGKLWSQLTRETEVGIVAVRAQSRDAHILSATGFIEAPHRIYLTSEVLGTVVEVPIKEGMVVQKGDLCVRLDDTRYQTELAQAEAAYEIAESRLKELRAGPTKSEIEQARAKLDGSKAERDLAAKALDRANRLAGTIAKSRHEQAVAALHQAESGERAAMLALERLEQGIRPEQIEAAEAEVEHAKAAIELAAYNCERTRIVAPEGGTILEKNVELGQFVRGDAPGLGLSLCVLADLTQLTAVVDISERDLSHVETGQVCEITTDAYPKRVYQGRLQRHSPVVNRQRGVVEVKVQILDTDEYLMPDMNCSVVIFRSDVNEDVVILPAECLAGKQPDIYVFVLDDDQTARRRPIQVVKAVDNEFVEVTGGLRDGELVLIANGAALQEGQRVDATIR